MLNTYYNPVRTYQGVGSLSVLPQLVSSLNPKKILLLIWDESVLENRYIKETAAAFADILIHKRNGSRFCGYFNCKNLCLVQPGNVSVI